MIQTREDKYGGLTILPSNLSVTIEEMRSEVTQLIQSNTRHTLLWINIPIEKAEFIPLLTQLQFEFHHCDEKNLTLVRKMNLEAEIPISKNFIAGVGAIVMTDGKLLVVKDRFARGYKLPGGYINKNETIKNALIREVFEETGIEVVFESIMNIGHFSNGQFGESNLYFVCTAKPINHSIHINDLSEIVEAKWMDAEGFIHSDEVNEYNKNVVRAAMHHTSLKLIEREIKLNVPGEVFF